jgi:hypothetical protein
VDGDGDKDLVIAEGIIAVDDKILQGVRASILFGRGDGTFAVERQLPLPNGYLPRAVRFADLDKDLVLDLLMLGGGASAEGLIFKGLGNGRFELVETFNSIP